MNQSKAVEFAEACNSVAERLEDGSIKVLSLRQLTGPDRCHCVLGHILEEIDAKTDLWDDEIANFLNARPHDVSEMTYRAYSENDAVGGKRMTKNRSHIKHMAVVAREFGEHVLRKAFISK